jgi:pimeloyl-ACP methyl ester carboxylesterase
MRRDAAALILMTMLAAGCAPAAQTGSVAPSSPPTAMATAAVPSAAPTGEFGAKVDVGGYSLFLECKGSGSPTVVLEAGLGSGPFVWDSIQAELAGTTRVCKYARAGLAPSENRPRGTATKDGLSAGFMAGETYRLLRAAGVTGPYVMVGHSYGGMLVRLFAFAHPQETAAVVLVDASSARQYEGRWLATDEPWFDGPTLVDKIVSAAELNAITSLGSIPLVVLTQSDMPADFEVDWSHFQDELATLSTNSLHMVAHPSGHMIMNDQGPLVVESIKAVLEAAAARTSLPACGPRFTVVHALCLTTTMTAQLDAWMAERAAVKPEAGSFPEGTYREMLTDADVRAVTGEPAGFKQAVSTWTFRDGHWTVSIVIDSAQPEVHAGTYAATKTGLTLVLPLDWKVPMTSGVYRLAWTGDAQGTVHFEQTDDWPREPDWTVPFLPVKGT